LGLGCHAVSGVRAPPHIQFDTFSSALPTKLRQVASEVTETHVRAPRALAAGQQCRAAISEITESCGRGAGAIQAHGSAKAG
jgi:hypothetical protein